MDKVIGGGGMAGLTVGHRLRDKDILLLEKEDRRVGKTQSVGMGQYVYNSGAQAVFGVDFIVARLAGELDLRLTMNVGEQADKDPHGGSAVGEGLVIGVRNDFYLHELLAGGPGVPFHPEQNRYRCHQDEGQRIDQSGVIGKREGVGGRQPFSVPC